MDNSVTSNKQDSLWKYLYLSHYISNDTPMYANDGKFTRVPLKIIDHGDTANTERWSLNNHTGTHIDFPRHFYSDGKTLNNFPAENFVIENICCIDLSKYVQPGYIYKPEDFEGRNIPENTEIILLKTGFELFRDEDLYWEKNPGYSDALADYFRLCCPGIRYFGFDSISLTSYGNRALGKLAHQTFLGGESPILLIEDMNLKYINEKSVIQNVIIAPLLVDHADGCPVTVIAKVNV